MEKKDKKLENFVDDIMNFDELDQPSADFTTIIMSEIDVVSYSQITQYKPLIPKIVWWILGLSIASLFAYVYMVNPETSYSLFENSGMTLQEELSFKKLNVFQELNVSFSKTSVYAVVFLAIMFCVQIPILKSYLNKRIEF